MYHLLKILKTTTKKIKKNKFSQVAGYDINMQKSVAFVFTNVKLSEKLR